MGKSPVTYPEKTAEQIGSKLDHLAQNPKGLQVKELVARLKPKIEAAQAAGYTLADIVDAFKTEGVSITLNTLKQYLRESRSLPSSSDSSQLPTENPKNAKTGKARTPAKPRVPVADSSPSESAASDGDEASQVKLTHTNDRGFQEMRSDDEL